MKRHASRGDSGFLQIKIRVPTDVRDRARGRRLTVDFPATATDPESSFSVTLGEFCKGSAQTRNARTADVRRLAVAAALAAFCDGLRRGPTPLSQRQIEALAGETYRLLLDEHGDDPGTPRQWESFKGLTRAAVEGRIPGAPPIPERGQSDDETIRVLLFGEAEGESLTETIDGMAASWETRALEQRVGRLAYWVMQRHGLEVDDETRLNLLRRIAVAALDAGRDLKRMSTGDYRPSTTAERFPRFQKTGKAAAGISLTDVFERWQRETKPAWSTVTTWRGILTDFERHLKHGDIVRVTDHDVVAWKDSRIAAGRSTKTVQDSDLACLRALFRFAVTNKIITANPAEGIKVKIKKEAGKRKLPYTDDEVARLLALAEKETLPHLRYVPLLAATTGSRVQDLVQLWAENVTIEEGVPVLRITPAADGGTLKTDEAERTIPIHPAVLSSGFIEFARAKGQGPLFYGSRPRRRARDAGEEAHGHASKGTANRVREWVRRQPGFQDKRKDPNHAMRQWLKTSAARIGLPDSVADILQGHAPGSVADKYRRSLPLRDLQAALAKIPIPTLPKGEADGAVEVPITADVDNTDAVVPRGRRTMRLGTEAEGAGETTTVGDG